MSESPCDGVDLSKDRKQKSKFAGNRNLLMWLKNSNCFSILARTTETVCRNPIIGSIMLVSRIVREEHLCFAHNVAQLKATS